MWPEERRGNTHKLNLDSTDWQGQHTLPELQSVFGNPSPRVVLSLGIHCLHLQPSPRNFSLHLPDCLHLSSPASGRLTGFQFVNVLWKSSLSALLLSRRLSWVAPFCAFPLKPTKNRENSLTTNSKTQLCFYPRFNYQKCCPSIGQAFHRAPLCRTASKREM